MIYNNPNQTEVIAKKNGAGIITYGPNGFWMKTGHCRRCVNGVGHPPQSGNGNTGLLLQRPGRHIYQDELAPGEKPGLRRRVRRREKAAVRRLVIEES
jgi:hypothetical protein